MIEIGKYRQDKKDSAAEELDAAMRALGWEDPDGTVVVQEEDWGLIVGLYGPDPKGFRLETELDRKRQERRESAHPEIIGELGSAIAEAEKYR